MVKQLQSLLADTCSWESWRLAGEFRLCRRDAGAPRLLEMKAQPVKPGGKDCCSGVF
jgi:hypothetical protein